MTAGSVSRRDRRPLLVGPAIGVAVVAGPATLLFAFAIPYLLAAIAGGALIGLAIGALVYLLGR